MQRLSFAFHAEFKSLTCPRCAYMYDDCSSCFLALSRSSVNLLTLVLRSEFSTCIVYKGHSSTITVISSFLWLGQLPTTASTHLVLPTQLLNVPVPHSTKQHSVRPTLSVRKTGHGKRCLLKRRIILTVMSQHFQGER